jgi:hypothetical protein
MEVMIGIAIAFGILWVLTATRWGRWVSVIGILGIAAFLGLIFSPPAHQPTSVNAQQAVDWRAACARSDAFAAGKTHAATDQDVDDAVNCVRH